METYWDSSWFNKYLTKEGAVPFFAMKMTCWAIIDCVQVVCDCETIRHRSQSTTLQHRFDGGKDNSTSVGLNLHLILR